MMGMNKIIRWIAYIWLLKIETLEQVVEYTRERFSNHNDSAIEMRPPT
jgi:hypothetical protein